MYSVVEHIARVIWLGRYSKENLMALFYAAYFDASATGHRNDPYPVLTVAGAVAPVKRWIRFVRDWEQVLKDENITEFHATDFAASLGEYKGWKGDKTRRANFLRRLGGIIKRDVNRLFMVTVELDAWSAVNQEYLLEETFHSPFALAGFSVLLQLRKWAQGKKISERRIQSVFEEGDAGWGGLKKLCARHNLDPIELPKPKAVPCQLGDFVAWKNRIAATNSLRRLATDPKQQTTPEVIENLRGILKELASLDKMLVRPGPAGVYSPKALIRTYQRSKVPKRSEFVPPSV